MHLEYPPLLSLRQLVKRLTDCSLPQKEYSDLK